MNKTLVALLFSAVSTFVSAVSAAPDADTVKKLNNWALRAIPTTLRTRHVLTCENRVQVKVPCTSEAAISKKDYWERDWTIQNKMNGPMLLAGLVPSKLLRATRGLLGINVEIESKTLFENERYTFTDMIAMGGETPSSEELGLMIVGIPASVLLRVVQKNKLTDVVNCDKCVLQILLF